MAINKIDYKGTKYKLGEEVEVLTQEDFFTSVNVPIEEFYAYRYGNIVNLQRVKFSSRNYTIETGVDAAVINPKYLPSSGDIPIRLLASTGASAINTIVFIEDGKMVIYTGKTITATEIFVFNESYIINDMNDN